MIWMQELTAQIWVPDSIEGWLWGIAPHSCILEVGVEILQKEGTKPCRVRHNFSNISFVHHGDGAAWDNICELDDA